MTRITAPIGLLAALYISATAHAAEYDCGEIDGTAHIITLGDDGRGTLRSTDSETKAEASVLLSGTKEAGGYIDLLTGPDTVVRRRGTIALLELADDEGPLISCLAYAPKPAAAPEGGASITVLPDGIALHGVPGDREAVTEFVAFGASRTEVETMMAAAGLPLSDGGRNEECGAGPLAFAKTGALQLAFSQDALEGWWLFDSEKRPVAESFSGIAIGTTQDAFGGNEDVVEATSLGMQFSIDGLFGYLDDEATDPAVNSMFAGLHCSFG